MNKTKSKKNYKKSKKQRKTRFNKTRYIKSNNTIGAGNNVGFGSNMRTSMSNFKTNITSKFTGKSVEQLNLEKKIDQQIQPIIKDFSDTIEFNKEGYKNKINTVWNPMLICHNIIKNTIKPYFELNEEYRKKKIDSLYLEFNKVIDFYINKLKETIENIKKIYNSYRYENSKYIEAIKQKENNTILSLEQKIIKHFNFIDNEFYGAANYRIIKNNRYRGNVKNYHSFYLKELSRIKSNEITQKLESILDQKTIEKMKKTTETCNNKVNTICIGNLLNLLYELKKYNFGVNKLIPISVAVQPTVSTSQRTAIQPTVTTPQRTVIQPTVSTPQRTVIQPTVSTPQRTVIQPTVSTPQRTVIQPTVSTPQRTVIQPTVSTPQRTVIQPTVTTPQRTAIQPTVTMQPRI